MLDLAAQVSDWRAANTALRKITANGGRNASTTYARTAHSRRAEEVMRRLLDAGHRELAGELTGEAGLLQRLSTDPARPELDARLRAARSRIRTLTASTAA